MTALRWMMRGLLGVMTLLTAGVFFLVMTQPGTITGYVTNGKGLDVFTAALPTSQANIKSVDPEPRGRLTAIQDRARADLAQKAAEDARQATPQWQNSARSTAQGGQAQTRATQQGTAAAPAYTPPTAQRKTLRVGDY